MPSDLPFVSVIIPVFNGEAFLAEAIESILRQDYEPLEIIVIDDGSTDETSTVAGRFPNIRYVFQENGGPPAARNRGLMMANGAVIAFLDADDLWPENKLELQLASLAAPPTEIAVGRRQIIRHAGGAGDRDRFEEFADPLIGLNLGSGLFRRSVFEKVGPFDETLQYSDDWDWFMRARELGVPIVITEDVVLFYRRHEHNLTNRIELNNRDVMKMLKKSLDRRRLQNNGPARSLPKLSEYGTESPAKRRSDPDDAGAIQPPKRLLVSVVVPVYNGDRFLAAALDSIYAQDYRPLEVIVVDDGSVDRTTDIAQSYQEARYIYQTNQGHGRAKNVGIAAARGKFLAFLDADDLWAPHKLRVQVDYLLAHPDTSYVTARVQNFIEPGTQPQPKRKDLLLTEAATMIVGALVARRSAFEAVGDFDTGYRHANDSDWFFRAREAGMPWIVLPEVLLYRRLHDSNLSYETRAMASELLRAVKSSIDRTRKRKSMQEPSRE